MSDPNREFVLELYREVYTNLNLEANQEIYDAITQTLLQFPNATYQELIATLKIHLLNIIDMLVKSQQQPKQEEQKEVKNLDTLGKIESNDEQDENPDEN